MAGGGVLAATAAMLPERVRADVVMGEIHIPHAEYVDDDGTLYAPWVKVTGTWRYNLETEPDGWSLYLLVLKPDDSWSAINVIQGSGSGVSDEGQFEIVGEVTAASAYTHTHFTAPDPGESKTYDLTLGLLLLVDRNGDTVSEAEATGSTTLTVKQPEDPSAIGGDGEIGFQNDSDSETPF
jgi:hypothetical protein